MRQAPRSKAGGAPESESSCVEKAVFESGLWIIILEMCCVVALATFIVWWTWPRKPKAQAKPDPKPETDKRDPQ
jgi:hypothetical protein